jgi:DNA-binding NarL/FixJ family response regulator
VKAAQMLAACDSLQRSGGWVRQLQERKDYERCLAQAQASMADEEFLAAWSAGQKMSLGLFLDEATPAQGAALEMDAQSRSYGALTSREIEVVRLVARGLSNREIASDLVIAVSTAERHVANILRKLDLTSRTQIAAWYVERTANAVLP